jgi:uncharacterized protein (TIGR02266 family)
VAAGGDKRPAVGSAAAAPSGAERRVSERGSLIVPLRCHFESVLDFVDTQSRNISRTGMFIETERPPPLGSEVDFEFGLVDGFTLLKGRARVVRVVSSGPVTGMGVQFLALDETMRHLIDRIVDVNAQEGRTSTLNFDFSRPEPTLAAPPATQVEREGARAVVFAGTDLKIVLSSETARYFTANPLLDARVGGFFVPSNDNPQLGAVFAVEIVDSNDKVIVAAKGKVLAKQDVRVGIRLVDADKDALARLRAEVARVSTGASSGSAPGA